MLEFAKGIAYKSHDFLSYIIKFRVRTVSLNVFRVLRCNLCVLIPES